MKKILGTVLLAALCLTACGRGSDKTYVLVHGAWSSASAWDKVKPLLEKEGATVVTVDLPAHGGDTTAASQASLQGYTDKVVAAVDAQKKPVILVGHSMGGTVISQVAEARPEKVKTLVYVAAYLLKNGESLYGTSQSDTESTLGQYLVPSQDGSTLSIKPEGLKDAFCAECDDAETQVLKTQGSGNEPAAPLGTPVTVSDANFGKVPRVYIHTLKDHAVGPALQERMYTATPVQKVLSIDSGHAPYLSHPEELSAMLLDP